MAITVLSHKDIAPKHLKFPAKWKSALDEEHVGKLAQQVAAGQRLTVTINAEKWVLKGRHSSAAYVLVSKGSKAHGIKAQPNIKVPCEVISGTPQEEKILELSSIVNQRKASPQETAHALKEMVELLAQQHLAESGKEATKQELVEKAAKATGKSARTVAKRLREATPEKERKPSKPRKKSLAKPPKSAPVDAPVDSPDPDTVVIDRTPMTPRDAAISDLQTCLTDADMLAKSLPNAMNSLFELPECPVVGDIHPADQLARDHAFIADMRTRYTEYIDALATLPSRDVAAAE